MEIRNYKEFEKICESKNFDAKATQAEAEKTLLIKGLGNINIIIDGIAFDLVSPEIALYVNDNGDEWTGCQADVPAGYDYDQMLKEEIYHVRKVN